MAGREHHDVATTLSELERKLVDLERELVRVAGGEPAPPLAPAAADPVPAAPRPRSDPALRVDDLRAQIDELVRFRERLEASAQQLLAEYERIVSRLQAASEAAGAPRRGAASADERGELSGHVVVDAGPFGDITTLALFEQALRGAGGAGDVAVRSFDRGRALIDVRLAEPVALIQRLRNRFPLPITRREADAGRLVVDLAPPTHAP